MWSRKLLVLYVYSCTLFSIVFLLGRVNVKIKYLDVDPWIEIATSSTYGTSSRDVARTPNYKNYIYQSIVLLYL